MLAGQIHSGGGGPSSASMATSCIYLELAAVSARTICDCDLVYCGPPYCASLLRHRYLVLTCGLVCGCSPWAVRQLLGPWLSWITRAAHCQAPFHVFDCCSVAPAFVPMAWTMLEPT